VNPRAVHYANIFRVFAPYAPTFSTYSDGANDDLNMLLMGAIGADSTINVASMVFQYVRLLIAPHMDDTWCHQLADVIFALERQWSAGHVIDNHEIDTTVNVTLQLQSSFAKAGAYVGNWRFQMIFYRACYDAFVRHRLAREENDEGLALQQLARAASIGSIRAMAMAQQILTPSSPVSNGDAMVSLKLATHSGSLSLINAIDLRALCFIVGDVSFLACLLIPYPTLILG
jgi:hypothetical protein